MNCTYKGYTVSRNRLDKRFYAYPSNDMTTCRRIVADTPSDLTAAIDAVAKTRSWNPWELPRRSA